jgi:Zn-dependent protease with chaperone function
VMPLAISSASTSACESAAPGPPGMLKARLFDGRQARARPVLLALEDGQLVARAQPAAAGEAAPDAAAGGPATMLWRWPLAALQWPERTRHGRRVIQLREGGAIECDDAAAFDAWRAAVGPGESWVVRVQQHWRSTLVALLLLVMVAAAVYRWGVPWAAERLTALVPAEVEAAIGDAAFDSLSQRWLMPSQLPAERQAALRKAFAGAIAATYAANDRPAWQLHFRKGGKALDANAFALPAGHIVITDELVALLAGHDDAVLGVLAHEYGHVRLRHGLQALTRFALVSSATAMALGDFSSLLAGAPAMLATLSYSRHAEREADAEAARVLRASGRSPAAMLLLFERLRKPPGAAVDPPIALASHPLDEERMRFFREAAR